MSDIIFIDPLIKTTLAIMITLFVKASVVIGAAYLVSRLFRQESAAFRYALWGTAFAVLLALPLVAMLFPSWQIGLHDKAWTPVTENRESIAPVPTVAPSQWNTGPFMGGLATVPVAVTKGNPEFSPARFAAAMFHLFISAKIRLSSDGKMVVCLSGSALMRAMKWKQGVLSPETD